MQYLIKKVIVSIIFLNFELMTYAMNNNPCPIFRSASGSKLKMISHQVTIQSDRIQAISNQIGAPLAQQLISPRAARSQTIIMEKKVEIKSDNKLRYTEKMPKNIATIFSFDGGGIRGLISATICKSIEDKIPNIWDRVNLFAGTSIGGGLAASLAIRDEEINAEKLQNLFLNDGEKVFQKTWKNWLTYGLFGSKYYSDGRKDIFSKILGDKKLSDLEKDLLVPTYNLNNQSGLFFSTNTAKQSRSNDYKLTDVVMATSAAPYYFDPFELNSVEDTNLGKPPILTADGGLIANDPTLCALSEASRIYPGADAFTLVSIGTGHSNKLDPIKYNNIIDLALNIPNIMVNTPSYMSKYYNYQLGYLTKKPVYFCRLDANIEDASHMLMDNTSQENLKYLINSVELDKELQNLISELCNFLKKYDTTDQANLYKYNGNRHNNFYLYSDWKDLKFVQTEN